MHKKSETISNTFTNHPVTILIKNFYRITARSHGSKYTYSVIRGLHLTSTIPSLPQKNRLLKATNIACISGFGSIVSQLGSTTEMSLFKYFLTLSLFSAGCK